MTAPFRSRASPGTIPITPVETAVFDAWRKSARASIRIWVDTTGFTAQPGSICLIAGEGGRLGRVLYGVESHTDLWAYAALPGKLAAGSYRIDARMESAEATASAIGWALGGYRFDRYKSRKPTKLPSLVWPRNADRKRATSMIGAICLVRDLINVPAEDMGPSQLAEAAGALGVEFAADVRIIIGRELLDENYPTIHAVGRASDSAPRLVDLRWGNKNDPKVTLVGKGVCFDTGGLDLKPANGMLRMKKDMGGGAHVLGLARLIMASETKVRLRVLLPAVENSVSGNAYRPLDVIRTRKGITVEVGNTDAEGRLIMCDVLTEACREKPSLIIDYATLTGAARIALGTDLPALFSNNDELADALMEAGRDVNDPVWRLPLWRPYRRLLDSKVADINNVSEGGMGGAITAALYLQEFVDDDIPWAHFDLMAWNLKAQPGRPVGGEAQALRAAFEVIERRFGS